MGEGKIADLREIEQGYPVGGEKRSGSNTVTKALSSWTTSKAAVKVSPICVVQILALVRVHSSL